MNEDFTPVSYLLKAQKLKYRAALIPILLVILGLLLSNYTKFSYAKYISLLGLIGYFWVILKFRIHKRVSPTIEETVIYAPIHGKIISVSEKDDKIIVAFAKGLFQPVEIRCPSVEKNTVISCEKGKISWFERSAFKPKKMVGIVHAAAIVKISFPKEYKLLLSKGSKVIAGETEIGKKQN